MYLELSMRCRVLYNIDLFCVKQLYGLEKKFLRAIYGWPWGKISRKYWAAVTHMMKAYWYIFSWEYGDSLKQFIEKINAFHPTAKLTVEWSKEEINFLDVTVRLRKRQLETDLYIKPTDPPQFLDSIYYHP